MPSCAAFSCSNTTGRSNKQVFVIPNPIKNSAEKARAAKWLHNMGSIYNIKTFSSLSMKVLCEDHFHPDCFKIDLKAKLLKGEDRKMLVDGAIPTIFSHNEFDQINMVVSR